MSEEYDEEENPKSSSQHRPIWLALITLVLFVAYLFTWRPPQKLVPGDLVGEWHTTDPGFADRWFDIDSVLIDFGTGEGTVSTGFIKEVKIAPDGNRTLYTISYSDNGALNNVSFYYDPGNDGTIRFRHQENVVWKKQPKE